MMRLLVTLGLCVLLCECAIPFREPAFDLGYGAAKAEVTADSIRVSIPVGDEYLVPEGPYYSVCSLSIKIGSYLSRVLVTKPPDQDGHVPYIWRHYVPRIANIFRNEGYEEYEDVCAYYDGAMHITFGPEWAGRAMEHRPGEIHIWVGEFHGTVPLQYHSD